MPTNLKAPLFEGGSRLSIKATGAITGGRFVKAGGFASGPGLNTSLAGGAINAAHAGAGTRATGVAESDVANGADGIMFCGAGMIVPVTAGAAIVAGAEVEVGTAGKAITLNTGRPCGQAINAAAADGDEIFVRLY